MYTSSQLRTWTIAHVMDGRWYLDCSINFSHPSEVVLWKSFKDVGAVDLQVEEFAGLGKEAKQKAIVSKKDANKEKEVKEIEVRALAVARESERLVKAAEKEKGREEKVMDKGKKKVDRSGAISPLSTEDQCSEMQTNT